MVRVALLVTLLLGCNMMKRAHVAGQVAERFLALLSAGDVDGARALVVGGDDLRVFGPMVEGLVNAKFGPAQFKGLVDDTARFSAFVATDHGPDEISPYLLDQNGVWKIARISRLRR
jgi:hypothetical protein